MAGELSRRGAIGGMLSCLIGPFIPSIPLPKEQPEEVKQTFYVEHMDHWSQVAPCLGRGSHFKFYAKDSMAAIILTELYDEGPCSSDQHRYRLLEFLWERHDHEAIDIL